MATTSSTEGTTRRRRDTALLVLNVCIVVVAVGFVWNRLRDRAGLGDDTPPALEEGDAHALPPRVSGSRPPDRGQVREVPRVVERADDAGSVPASEPRIQTDDGAAESQPDVPAQGDRPPPPLRLRGQVDGEPRGPAVSEVPELAVDLPALAATESAVDRIGVSLEVLHTIRGEYPSSAVAAYGANRGIEALHVALAKVGRVADLRLGDTDDDGRLEILDAWGRPLLYFSPDDYDDEAQRWVPGDGAAIDVSARRSGGSGSVRGAVSYQLFSVGADGRPAEAEGDDVTSWVSRD